MTSGTIGVEKRRFSVFDAWLPIVIGLLAYATVLARGRALLADPDVYLHVTVGRWILSHATVPHTDLFSYTFRGAPWVVHEWLSEVILAFSYDRLGWIGLYIVTAAAFALAMAVLAYALRTFLPPTYAVIGVLSAWGLSFPSLVARPHVLAFPLVVAWIAVLVKARANDRAPSPVAALLMVLWANLHPSFMLGLAFLVLVGGEALFEAGNRHALRRLAIGWAAFAVLSVAATLATPNGLAGFLLPIQLVRMDFALAFISEWQSPNFQKPQPVEIWLMLLILGALLFGIRLAVTRVVMVLILLHLALMHVRNVAMLGLMTPLLLAAPLAPQLPHDLDALVNAALVRWPRRRRALAQIAASLAAIVLAAGATLWPRGIIQGVDRFTPAAALAAATPYRATPVFNDFNFGSFLIFAGVPTFIDGRADMYGDQFLRRYADREEFIGILAQYNIGWTLLGVNHPDVAILDRLPGWRRVYADKIAVVHARDASP